MDHFQTVDFSVGRYGKSEVLVKAVDGLYEGHKMAYLIFLVKVQPNF